MVKHNLFTKGNISFKIGLIGAAALVAERIALWQQIAGIRYSFFASEILPNLQEGKDYTLCYDLQKLIEQADAIDLVDESEQVSDYFQMAVMAHKDVFFANPFALDLDSLRLCALLVKESRIICQPGLYLRFQEDIREHSRFVFRYLESGISLAADKKITQKQWLALVNNHVDLLSYLAHSPIKRIAAFSLAINNIEHALLNFRIQFDNSSVANCTININAMVEEQVSALYNEAQQKLILWTKNNAFTHDIFDQNCVINAMEHFIRHSIEQVATKVTIFDALNTVELSKDIINQIEA